MERKKIHPEGPEFSRMITGAWRWGTLPVDAVKNLIDTSIDVGITTFDHADIYGNYSCEELFGKAIQNRSAIRSKLQFVSKCGIRIVSDKMPDHKIPHYDTTYNHIMASAESSLNKLKTDYLDLLLIHRPDPLMYPEEIAKAFNELIQSGKVKYFGVSNFTAEQFEMLASYVPMPLVNNQIELSLFKPELFFDGIVDVMMKHRIVPMAWSPLGGGEFFNDQDRFNGLREVMDQLTKKYECTISQLVFAWLLKHPAALLPILGTSKSDRIKESVKALSITLDRQDWFLLLKASRGFDIP